MGAGPSESADVRLQQAIALLRSLVLDAETRDVALEPWQQTYAPMPSLGGRISATDRLSWWFRPAAGGEDPWDRYFDEPEARLPDFRTELAPVPAQAPRPAPGRLAGLRLVLDEPDDELIDDDAEAVVTCLYDFVHAIGRRDVGAALECVAADYHTLSDDREIDRDGLAAQVKSLLDPLRGWELEVALVEIPQPVLHPDGILVYAEIQIEARQPDTDERRSWLDRRIAVFTQQRDRSWRIAALSAI